MSRYVWTEDMGEISGMARLGIPNGLEYEQQCRVMLFAGVNWLDANPALDPRYEIIPGVFGVISSANPAAKSLEDAILKSTPDATGAMMHAVILNLLRVKRIGWDEYVIERKLAALPIAGNA